MQWRPVHDFSGHALNHQRSAGATSPPPVRPRCSAWVDQRVWHHLLKHWAAWRRRRCSKEHPASLPGTRSCKGARVNAGPQAWFDRKLRACETSVNSIASPRAFNCPASAPFGFLRLLPAPLERRHPGRVNWPPTSLAPALSAIGAGPALSRCVDGQCPYRHNKSRHAAGHPRGPSWVSGT